MVPMGGHGPSANPVLMDRYPAAYAPMGITAENVAKRFNVSRADQDTLLLRATGAALAAIDAGKFKDEIAPIEVDVWNDAGEKKRVTFSVDEGPRRDTSIEGLTKLKPAFDMQGSVTAGNSSASIRRCRRCRSR